MTDARYKKYLLFVLASVLAFNYSDRLALGLVLQDIKLDLKLSDTQLGLLTGIAFAIFYSAMGIPIARWADRGNRVHIIAITTAAWSVMVALCGAVGNFAQLLLVRIGVAVGEAGCIPPAHSLIPDHFTRAERPRAVSRYMLGGSFSLVIGYFAAGWLNQLYGWRIMFVLLALPGIALAALALLTLREPRRASATAIPASVQTSMREVYRTLWALPTFRHLLFGFSAIFFLTYGLSQWLPAFFIRFHGLKTGELGTWFTVLGALTAAVGVVSGGELASRYAPNNERLQLKVLGILFGSLILMRPLTYLVPDYRWALVLMMPTALVSSLGDGPLFAVVQSLVPQRMRAMSIATIYLVANLIGMGLGPLSVGILSDLFKPWAGEESLRYALIAMCPGYLLAMWHLWRASQTVTEDLEKVRVADQGAVLDDVRASAPAN